MLSQRGRLDAVSITVGTGRSYSADLGGVVDASAAPIDVQIDTLYPAPAATLEGTLPCPASPPPVSGNAAGSCTFWFLKASFVQSFRGKKLPFFQEIRASHPDALVQLTITYTEVVCGEHVAKRLAVSHRWMKADDADPDGEQLRTIKQFLASDEGKPFELVWLDAQCMPQDQPQGSRTADDTVAFKTMLSQVNMLYLGTSVLILLDLSYVSRFWTQVRRETDRADPTLEASLPIACSP